MKLVVQFAFGRDYFRIFWEDGEDVGGHLCQDKTDGEGPPPVDRDDWEHWCASRAVRTAPGVQFDSFGAYWETEKEALAALRIARAALSQDQDRELPEWAKTAISQGWKAPKNWTP
jgi:hypothetical protein